MSRRIRNLEEDNRLAEDNFVAAVVLVAEVAAEAVELVVAVPAQVSELVPVLA